LRKAEIEKSNREVQAQKAPGQAAAVAT